MIKLSLPSTDDKEIKALEDTLRSGWLAHGSKNDEFESLFAKYIGVKHAVSLNSCASALHLALVSLGIRGEVILPSFTFVAAANAVVTAGAKPVFCDVLYDTCNMNPDDLQSKITPQTEAIMPVHYGGQACDMERILKIARKHKLAVIEDSAETLGGEYQGRKTGSFGTGCFSFFPTKNITTGEGGMLTTNDTKLAAGIKALSAHGISWSTLEREKVKKPWHRSATCAGYNFRMSNLLAAIGVEQMKKLESMNEKRRHHANYLNLRLKKIEALDIPIEMEGAKHVYQMYAVKVKGDRDKAVSDLRAKGIGASVHFDPPIHTQTYYAGMGYGDVKLPVTETLSRSIMTLPMYPDMSDRDLNEIVKAIQEVL